MKYMEYILGINACFTSNHHDPSVALLKNGKPIFALEEERLNRNKTSSGMFPVYAMQKALKSEGINIQDISKIGVPGITAQDLISKIKRIILHYFDYCPEISIFHHEHCHAAGAHFSSGFETSNAIALDGYGDKSSGCKLYIDKGRITEANDYKVDQSLGLFYGIFTEYLGFKRAEGEFKVMGMAAYGTTRYDLSEFFDKRFQADKITNYINKDAKITSLCEPYYLEEELKKVIKNLPQRRLPGGEFTQEHFDLAASVQEFFQISYKKIVQDAVEESGNSLVTLSGGCALNCLANSELMGAEWLDDFYIQPAASDRGLSLGAAYLACHEAGVAAKPCTDMYLGMRYTPEEIRQTLETAGVRYRESADIYQYTSEMISEGAIIGWFQGRSEFGPRALGSRSILADATSKGIKDKINSKIKFRESYRPFAPIVSSNFTKKMSLKKKLEHMTVAVFPERSMFKEFGDTIHADGSTRIQEVDPGGCNEINKLVHCYERKGGSALVNTSFNLAGEPLVEHPRDALRTFHACGIDKLVMGPFIVEK